MTSAPGFVFLLVLAGFALGWLVPLIMGIVRLSKKGEGTLLVALGGIWGFVVLALALLLAQGVRTAKRAWQEETFHPAEHKGPTGPIVVPHKGESVLVVQDVQANRTLRLTTTDGTLLAPVGDYRLISYSAIATDAQKRRWLATSYLASARQRTISVKAEAPPSLDVGPPFKASVSVAKSGQDAVRLDFKLIGAAGDSYVISREGRSDAPPSFQAVSPSGEVLWQGQFEYG